MSRPQRKIISAVSPGKSDLVRLQKRAERLFSALEEIFERSLQHKAVWEFWRNSYNNILQMHRQMVQNCPRYMLDAEPNGSD